MQLYEQPFPPRSLFLGDNSETRQPPVESPHVRIIWITYRSRRVVFRLECSLEARKAGTSLNFLRATMRALFASGRRRCVLAALVRGDRVTAHCGPLTVGLLIEIDRDVIASPWRLPSAQ
jgi:hypothetical protein